MQAQRKTAILPMCCLAANRLFDTLVFDEFHIFQAPQIVSVLNAMLLIREVTGQSAQEVPVSFCHTQPVAG